MIPSMVDAPAKHFFLKYIEMLKKQEILWWRLHIEKALWKGNRSCKKDTRSLLEIPVQYLYPVHSAGKSGQLCAILDLVEKELKIAARKIGYGTVRFFIEFTRQPDPQLGFILGPFSMGQILCASMILSGLLIIAIRRQPGKVQAPSKGLPS
jgi:hypothetical protein